MATIETMSFCERRYAKKMIIEFSSKRKIANQLGGDVDHFDRLIVSWKNYLMTLIEKQMA